MSSSPTKTTIANRPRLTSAVHTLNTKLVSSGTNNGKLVVAHIERNNNGGYTVYWSGATQWDGSLNSFLADVGLDGSRFTADISRTHFLQLFIPKDIADSLDNTQRPKDHLRPYQSPGSSSLSFIWLLNRILSLLLLYFMIVAILSAIQATQTAHGQWKTLSKTSIDTDNLWGSDGGSNSFSSYLDLGKLSSNLVINFFSNIWTNGVFVPQAINNYLWQQTPKKANTEM